ncbi:MAG TPA: ABC transporter permease [Myxococcota bacterium]
MPATPAAGWAEAAPTCVIAPRRGWTSLGLAELWRYRELALFLALRDVRVRYKQSLLGAAWAVLQPLLTMVVFSILFGALLGRDRMPTQEGIPYAVSTYCALVPWQLFARSVTASADSLVANQNLISKVYFPRLINPIAPTLAAVLDFALAFAVLVAMLLFYGIAPGLAILALPGFVLLVLVTALSVSLWLAAINAIYRDVRHAVPFLVQLWMFLTPVVYTSASLLGDRSGWLATLYGMNPMVGVIEAFRWALLGGAAPPVALLLPSISITAVLFVGGLYFFRRMERTFVDLV